MREVIPQLNADTTYIYNYNIIFEIIQNIHLLYYSITTIILYIMLHILYCV